MKTVIHIVGFVGCKRTDKSLVAMNGIKILYAGKVDVDAVLLEDKAAFTQWLADNTEMRAAMGAKALAHTASPFGWTNDDEYIGAVNDMLNYARAFSRTTRPPAPRVFPDATPEGDFDYDLIVIGGGSGGLACSKEAVGLGQRVCVLDFVKPSPAGSTWGLGGTCVNVGCIPKKLMHQASVLGGYARSAEDFGWAMQNSGHNWEKMVGGVQDYIHSLNFKYRVDLRDKNVEYRNALGRFTDPHTVECTDGEGQVTSITGRRIVVAVGGRPKPLAVPGGEHCISSDDIFSMTSPPGKTLVVGGSYVALECAGFLAGLGYDTTVCVRSILLRGFDQAIAEMIGEYMKVHGCRFLRPATPTSVEKQADGRLLVRWTGAEGEEGSDVFDTVLVAVGRDADTTALNLAAAGVNTTDGTGGKIITRNEQTSCPHIYAIGDVVRGVPELTPAAIQAGQMLSQRLYGGSSAAMDYSYVATTVFTPVEYGCVGLSEEDAMVALPQDLEVYHSHFTPLEWSLAEGVTSDHTYCKLLVDLSDRNRIVGFHFLGPHAGEVTQGFATAIKLGATFDDIKTTVGIHPTCAEVLTTLTVTKSSGESAAASAC